MVCKDYGYQDALKTWSHKYLFLALLRLLGKPRGPILDIGCGNGSLTLRLLEVGHDIFGLDASGLGIAIANKKCLGVFLFKIYQQQRCQSN